MGRKGKAILKPTLNRQEVLLFHVEQLKTFPVKPSLFIKIPNEQLVLLFSHSFLILFLFVFVATKVKGGMK